MVGAGAARSSRLSVELVVSLFFVVRTFYLVWLEQGGVGSCSHRSVHGGLDRKCGGDRGGVFSSRGES